MRESENCFVNYCGFKSPRSQEEMQFEILGLERLIKISEERISMLKQSSFIANLAVNGEYENLEDFFSKSNPNDQNNSIKEKE